MATSAAIIVIIRNVYLAAISIIVITVAKPSITNERAIAAGTGGDCICGWGTKITARTAIIGIVGGIHLATVGLLIAIAVCEAGRTGSIADSGCAGRGLHVAAGANPAAEAAVVGIRAVDKDFAAIALETIAVCIASIARVTATAIDATGDHIGMTRAHSAAGPAVIWIVGGWDAAVSTVAVTSGALGLANPA